MKAKILTATAALFVILFATAAADASAIFEVTGKILSVRSLPDGSTELVIEARLPVITSDGAQFAKVPVIFRGTELAAKASTARAGDHASASGLIRVDAGRYGNLAVLVLEAVEAKIIRRR